MKNAITMYKAIQSSERVGIFTHSNPDGDALGSTIGMIGYLMQNGKDFRLFLPSEPGEGLSFMITPEVREKTYTWNDNRAGKLQKEVDGCDLIICMDFNNPERAGGYASLLSGAGAGKILVDHHIAPAAEMFDIIHSVPGASSTCELVYYILKGMPDIDGDAARMSGLTRRSLLTGMTTDTNNFANSTTPETFRMAAELTEAGTDREEILQNLYFSYPKRRIEAQGYILDRVMKITPDGVAYMIVDRRIQKTFNLQEGDTEGFVNIPLSIKEVKLSILLKREMHSDRIRVSIRSKKGVSARDLAVRYFHGGGHEQASGGRLTIGEDLKKFSRLSKYVEKSTHEFFAEQ